MRYSLLSVYNLFLESQCFWSIKFTENFTNRIGVEKTLFIVIFSIFLHWFRHKTLVKSRKSTILQFCFFQKMILFSSITTKALITALLSNAYADYTKKVYTSCTIPHLCKFTIKKYTNAFTSPLGTLGRTFLRKMLKTGLSLN